MSWVLTGRILVTLLVSLVEYFCMCWYCNSHLQFCQIRLLGHLASDFLVELMFVHYSA